jgi:hypothetical protein
MPSVISAEVVARLGLFAPAVDFERESSEAFARGGSIG